MLSVEITSLGGVPGAQWVEARRDAVKRHSAQATAQHGSSLTPGVSDTEPEKPAFLMMSWESSVILGNTRPASRLEGTPPGDSGSPRPETHSSLFGRCRSGEEAQWPHRALSLTLRGPDAPSPATQPSPSGLSSPSLHLQQHLLWPGRPPSPRLRSPPGPAAQPLQTPSRSSPTSQPPYAQPLQNFWLLPQVHKYM